MTMSPQPTASSTQPHTPAAEAPASDQQQSEPRAKQSRGTARLITAGIVIASVVIAGLFAQIRDRDMSDSKAKAPLGKSIKIARGQTFAADDVRIGSYYVTGGNAYSSSRVSLGRLVVVKITIGTARDRTISGLYCGLRTRSGGWVLPTAESGVSTPESGFESTQDLAFEIATDDLAGAKLDCNPSSTIVFHDVAPFIDLKITQEAVDAGHFKTVVVNPMTTKALP